MHLKDLMRALLVLGSNDLGIHKTVDYTDVFGVGALELPVMQPLLLRISLGVVVVLCEHCFNAIHFLINF